MEKRFGISDAARQVGVEAHVLRYWEDELGLAIPRNGQGHRYYREQDIHILHKIRDWKEQGFQLRAIKLLLPDRRRVEAMTPQELYHLREELNQKVQMEEDRSPKHARMGQVTPLPSAMEVAEPVSSISKEQKLQQFEQMMRDMITSVVEQQTQQSEERIAEAVTEKVSKQMDYLMREKEELQQKQIEILEKKDEVEKLNSILHEYSNRIIGRMGMPYSKKSINIITIVIDAPQDEINTLSGKIGKLSGITSKVIYSNK